LYVKFIYLFLEYCSSNKLYNIKKTNIVIKFNDSRFRIYLLLPCKKEPVYSCNEGLNNYAYQTMSGHAGISRDNLAKFGIDTQFAIFMSLPASGKLRIFTEKFALLLEDASISKTDKDHLETLINYVGEGI
jgi:hypothetical protein